MKRTSILLAAMAALALAGCQKTSDDAFGQRVRAYLLAHPEVIREAVQKLQENEQLAATKASTTAIRQNRDQLERDPRDVVINPDGKVTVVEFFDYRCPYCKVVAPEVVRIAQQDRDVRFVFKQFPIFGSISDTAAKVALTPEGKAKGLALYSALMSEKALDDQILDKDLRAVGLDPAAVRKASADPAIDRQLLETRALAQSLKIEGTPAFVVGDTMVPGADIGALRAAITQAKGAGVKRLG